MQEWTTTACPDQVSRLRHAVAGFAADQGLPTRRVDDVAIAVSELVSNAVVHAYRHSDKVGTVKVLARRSDRDIVIRIVDDGLGLRPRDDSPGAGLGLQIAGLVADDLEISERYPSGTEVRLTFAAAAA